MTDLATWVDAVADRVAAEFNTLRTGLTVHTHDHPSLQAAVDSLGPAGGTVEIGVGTWPLPLEVPAGVPVVLQGRGIDATVLTQTSATEDGITGSDVENLVIRDLTVRGPGPYTGTGTGINLTVSGAAGNATYYVEMDNVHVAEFGVDGIAVETPIVSRFARARAFKNGRHGFHLHTDGDIAGTSTHLDACFAAGNHGAGYRLDQQAYSVLSACAADANGIAYDLDTCTAVTANGCGCEEPYDFTGFHAGYAGHAWRLVNTKATLNSPYMIGNPGVALWVTSNSRVTINNLHESSPGNPDSPSNNPTASLRVDSSCEAVVNAALVTTAMDLTAGTTTVMPRDARTVQANAQTGSYTLGVADAGRVITITSAAAATVTVPTNTAAAVPVGSVVLVEQHGAGTVSVAASSGVTVQSRGSVSTLAGQWAAASLRKLDTNVWLLSGDLV